MITKNDIRQYIKKELLGENDTSDLTDELDLIALNIMDSLAVLKFVTFLEDQYQISLDIEELDFDVFTSINSIYNYIKDK
ncbi:MAG: acyl carrier protein [Spirochaetales bacterium]|nr:acyl carrier protein [Spirochaetales bacterium]